MPGITMVNIGVGPSNAKTITDHIAVLRPHVWLMLGHCAGLRNSQSLGDYVLAHAYMREDHVLDDDLPVWVPIPALAEVQVALENAVAEVTGLAGLRAEEDHAHRHGRHHRQPQLGAARPVAGRWRGCRQARAIALDMESATIAANGFRFRVPYGTLLCVSDKPLHGELKLPGMATDFYKRQVAQHLPIGIRAMEKLARHAAGEAALAQAAQLSTRPRSSEAWVVVPCFLLKSLLSPGLAWPNDAAEFTAFSVSIKSPAYLDLTMPPFARQKDAWMHKADYADCQAFAETSREAGVELIAYRSVRDPGQRRQHGGACLRRFFRTGSA